MPLARLALVLGAAGIACADDPLAPPTAHLAPLLSDSVFIGRSQTLVLVSAHDSAVITASPALWETSDTTIALSLGGGRILGVGAGTVTVSAELDGRRMQIPLRVVPMRVDGGRQFLASGMSSNETCALDTGGIAYCGSAGGLDSLGTLSAIAGGTGSPFVEFHSSRFHWCGLKADRRIACAGNNFSGQLGLGVRAPAFSQTLVSNASAPLFSGIAVGGVSGSSAATCGIGYADSVVYCVGTANVATDTVFRMVNNGFRALAISLGRGHACAIGLDRAAYCWGSDVRGLVGSVSPTLVPQLIPGGDRFVELVSGSHSCGITEQRQLKCWGSNQNGQLGIGAADVLVHATPAVVDLGGDVAFAVAGNSFTCGVTVGGALYCWGQELPIDAALATRLGSRLDAPVRMAPGVSFQSVSADARRVCGVTTARAIVCL